MKLRVAHVDQHRVARNRQQVELGLDDEAQRAFGAAEHAVEVEAAVALAQVREVVAGEAAVQLGKALLDQRGIALGDPVRAAPGIAHAARACQLGPEFVGSGGAAFEALAARQHDLEREHVVARLAVACSCPGRSRRC